MEVKVLGIYVLSTPLQIDRRDAVSVRTHITQCQGQ